MRRAEPERDLIRRVAGWEREDSDEGSGEGLVVAIGQATMQERDLRVGRCPGGFLHRPTSPVIPAVIARLGIVLLLGWFLVLPPLLLAGTPGWLQ